MIIDSLKLKRFGGHEAVDFNCGSSLVGIFGPNGAGKSTLMEALKFAITGETEQGLTSYVKDLAGSGSVTVRFRKNGKQGCIERNIGTKATRCLAWDGRLVTSAKEVTSLMREIFGADKKAVANAVFVSQGQMQNMLFSKQADRCDAFVEILNLSFCEGRAEVILRKVQKLQSTMPDLTPARDAALTHKDYTVKMYTEKKTSLEGFYSWEKENIFLAETEQARNERGVFQGQRNQAATDYQIKCSEMQGLLSQYSTISLDACEVALNTSTDRVKCLEVKLAEIQSVRAELSHYDRVDADVAKIYAEVGEVQQKIMLADPDGIGLVEWTKKKLSLEEEDRQAMRRQHLVKQKADETVNAAKLSRCWPSDPGFGMGDLENLASVTKSKGEVLSLHCRNFEMQKEIVACFASGVFEGKTRCPKCDLTITDANRLSPEDMRHMASLELDLRKELELLDTEYSAKKRLWDVYLREYNRTRDAIEGCQNRIQTLTIEIDGFPLFDTDLIALNKTQVSDVVSVLQSATKEMHSAQNRFSEKVKERSGYFLANKHKRNRSEYSDDVVVSLVRDRDIEKNNVLKMTEQLQNLRRADREVTRLTKLYNDLTEIISQRDVLLNKAETPALLALRQEIPDAMLLRAEVSARFQQYNVLKGQVEQLEEAYTKANAAFYDIEDRMKKDEVKRALISDLLKLKDLLSSDGLPLSFSRLQFEVLARMTQESLSKLDAQFSIDIDRSRDLAFTFKRLDRDGGVELPMSNLSGGQKVRLCVAFLMAVQRHLVPDVGLLVIDEPTTSVDPEGRQKIAEFLVSLAQELNNTEMQIWVCDHSSEVKEAIDCKLELK